MSNSIDFGGAAYTYDDGDMIVDQHGDQTLRIAEGEFGSRDYLRQELVKSGIGLSHIDLLDQYDPTRELTARTRHQEKMRGLMGAASQNIWDVYKGHQSAVGQSGFAGTGSLSKTVQRAEENVIGSTGREIGQSRLQTRSDIEGYRQSYLDSLSQQLTNLATTTGDKSGAAGAAYKRKGGWLQRLLPGGDSGYEDAYGNKIDSDDKADYGI